MPADAVGIALVAAHDPDRAKTHPGVAADSRFVVGRRVDHQAMMARIVLQEADQRVHGLVPAVGHLDARGDRMQGCQVNSCAPARGHLGIDVCFQL